MKPKRKSPGSKKGVPKPLKRSLDPAFGRRLHAAMILKGYEVPELAKLVKCTRAALGKYLSGASRGVEALLLFEIAEKLEVSPSWLLKGEGSMTSPQQLDPEKAMVLTLFGMLNEDARSHWLKTGEDLKNRQAALFSSREDPFAKASFSKKSTDKSKA